MRYGAARPRQPLGRHGPGVADAVAARHRELRRAAGGDARRRTSTRPGREVVGCLRRRTRPRITPRCAHHFENLAEQKEAASLGMWVFIAQEIMFFGGLFLAYTVYRNLYPTAFAEASHHLDWKLGAHQHRRAHLQQPHHGPGRARGRPGPAQGRSSLFLLAHRRAGLRLPRASRWSSTRTSSSTTWCPGRTSSSTGPNARPAQIFYSLYFAMTGLHALHMIIGIPILAAPGLAGRAAAATGPRTTRRWR